MNRKFALSQSPQWLRKVCGRMLSNILTGPNGVLNIIKGMLGNVPGKARQFGLNVLMCFFPFSFTVFHHTQDKVKVILNLSFYAQSNTSIEKCPG